MPPHGGLFCTAASTDGDGGADKVVPTNLLELATTIYVQNLVSGSPCALVSTTVHSLRPFAKKMESVLNQIPDEIGLKDTLQHCVLEALFSILPSRALIMREGRL